MGHDKEELTMFGKINSRNRRKSGGVRALRAQALVEFSIALPVLLMLLIGIMEVSRMLFMYASVVNSSRDAVRYASAYGRSEDLGDGNLLKYKYCDGIRDIAKKSGFFLNLQDADIDIDYDGGPGVSLPGGPYECDETNGEDPDINVDTGDRVTVTVSADYDPILTLLPLPSRTFTASSSRTILGVLDLDN
jgi:hypothetical protein